MSLSLEVKELLISSLNLEDISVSDIKDDAPLFTGDLGLDSIDALELGVALKKKYNVSVNADDKGAEKHFESVNTIVSFLETQIANPPPAT